ncbi:SET domain-containing protein-lysine N-methyltransferase [bacterium]|nr:SET domain-containing protein-lysine N-methyltransferase [bacterium]
MDAEKKTWLNPVIEIRNSHIHGEGLFAVSAIKKDDVLIIWGDGYTNLNGALEASMNGKKTMQWDEDVFSVEIPGNKDPYSINHSCDPNAWMEGVFKIVARRDICAGEEITADYALWEADDNYVSKWECKCGSKFCRGKVTGKDWRNKELQERYRGHFSPLINKRIKSKN